MSSELRDTLKERLDANYTAFMESLQKKTASELIAMAPEITAAQQLHEELLDACDEEDVAFLLRFDDPLETVRGYWESEITGYDHSGEMGHMLWRVQEDIGTIRNSRRKSHLQKTRSPLIRLWTFPGKRSLRTSKYGLMWESDFKCTPM